MSTLVLIHGAWHGGWCWHKLSPLLLAAGHKVITPDLPGHGDNQTPPASVTMDMYVRTVTDILDQLEEPACLVGHSMGGIIITEAAERRSDKLEALVYLAAFLPRNGESLASLEQVNTYSSVPLNLVTSADGRTATVLEEKVVELFYHDCSPADIEFARRRLCPQSLGLLNMPVRISPAKYGRVPRHYIKCTADQALRDEFQDTMLAATPGTTVHELNASHSPFFSMPEQLARVLLSICDSRVQGLRKL